MPDLITHMLAEIPERYHNLYCRAHGINGHTLSRTAAVKAMCLECQGWGHDSGVVDSIRYCETNWCPLHTVRPYQDKDELPEMNEEEARAYAEVHERKVEALMKARAARVAQKTAAKKVTPIDDDDTDEEVDE